jgi:NitT/TauT family transport system substrate-binding protein
MQPGECPLWNMKNTIAAAISRIPHSEFRILLLLLLTLFSLSSCFQESNSGPMESIRLGTVLLEPSVPIFVAQERNFFSVNNLDVAIKYYDVGLNAAKGVLNGEVDLSTPVAEYVLVGRIFEKKELKAVASIDKVDYAFVAGRKDRGINAISDLKGKKIGVVRGTILDFQLGRFLDLHGLSIRNVELVNGTLKQSADAIARGDIDAVMSIPPFIGDVQAQLGDNAVLWPAQNSQPFHSLVLGLNEWIAQHPVAVERFLKAMRQAEDYIAQNPDQAKAILKKRLNFTDDEVDRVWSQNQFALSLDQSLIAAMEDEARWMIKNGLTTEKDIPDFLNYLYLDGLEAVKPEAVSIIH